MTPERTPSVSVVVPVGSVDTHLREQLDALAAQTGAPAFELIAAGNVPGTAALAALRAMVTSYGRPSWRAVDAADRRGPSHARNVGASFAAADLLAFCDADDIVDVHWLGSLVTALADQDAVTGHTEGFGLPRAELDARPHLTPGQLPRMMGVPYLLAGNLGVRREVFRRLGGFDEDMKTCEDMALTWALRSAGFRIGWAPEARIRYRYRAGFVPMLRQHFRYGRGMSQLLLRYGVPDGDRLQRAGTRLFRANGQPVASKSWRNSARRVAIALGRVFGIVEHGARTLRTKHGSR